MANRAGMPALYNRVHDAIKRKNPGWTDSRVWATTVSAIAKGALTGDTNFPGRQDMGPIARAEYAAAYAQWKKSHPKGTGFGKNYAGRG